MSLGAHQRLDERLEQRPQQVGLRAVILLNWAAVLSLGITSNERLAGLFSIASMIAVMNSVVAGSGVTLAVVSAAGPDGMGVGVPAGC